MPIGACSYDVVATENDSRFKHV